MKLNLPIRYDSQKMCLVDALGWEIAEVDTDANGEALAGLASRVEELEKGLQEIVDDGCEGCYEVAKRVLAKHPSSPRPIDSGSGGA